MPRWIKKLAIALAALIVLSGSAFTFGAAVDHDVGIEKSMDAPTQGNAQRDTHGCAAHLAAHLVTLPEARVLRLGVAEKAALGAFLPVRGVPCVPDSFFRPPRFFLA